MNEKEAFDFALLKFKNLNDLEQQWNYIHSKEIIESLKELIEEVPENLKALAWIHDIGKIEGEDNHAEKSIKILEKTFQLTETDKDCILNHGSSGNPKTKEGKVFRNADGLSIFQPESLLFRFWGEAQEGKSFDEIKETMKKTYKKYLKAYGDNPKAIQILNKKYTALFLSS